MFDISYRVLYMPEGFFKLHAKLSA